VYDAPGFKNDYYLHTFDASRPILAVILEDTICVLNRESKQASLHCIEDSMAAEYTSLTISP
jgi:hypothetical protein